MLNRLYCVTDGIPIAYNIIEIPFDCVDASNSAGKTYIVVYFVYSSQSCTCDFDSNIS